MMQFHFKFKHMETSEALQAYSEEKLRERIKKFVTKAISVDVVFSVTKHQHTVHVSLQAGDNFGIEVENTQGDMYAAVDGLMDKLTSQLHKRKERLKDHKSPRLVEGLSLVDAATPREEPVDAQDILKYENGLKRAGVR